MKEFEPTPKRVIERGTDPLGDYWQVYYEWRIGDREFSFGSARILEDLSPEEDYLDEISQAVFQHVDYMIASACAKVDMITTANGGWTVKAIKRDKNGLYQERIKTFYDFNEAVAFVKDVKYPVLFGALVTLWSEQ
jgi:hypothetical protein